jgi:hypothetical protein
MAESEIDYGAMLQRALRSVVREVLERTVREGLPGEHHFYLSLRTDHPGTQVPPFLRQRFPEEITVVLQHQFRDLTVDGEGFAVTLRFDGMPARLVVPWDAVVAFFDPTAEFGLRFDMPALAGAGAQRSGLAAVPPAPAQTDAAPESEAAADAPEGGEDADGAKVLSFGRPRDRRGSD